MSQSTQKDCIQDVTEDEIRRIHSHQNNGKVLKGYSTVPHTSSIPSKYQTLIIKDNKSLGFGAKSKRFQLLCQEDNPGPGKYKYDIVKKKCSKYDSLKGVGGLAVKDQRLANVIPPPGPGPGTISLSRSIITRNDFNKTRNTPAFQLPVAFQTQKEVTPAPNQYTQISTFLSNESKITTDACFKSRTRRDFRNIDNSSFPAPCDYLVNDVLTRKAVHNQSSIFKSKSIRKLMKDPPPYPGPAAYNPLDPIEVPQKLVFPKKHYLCISAPAMTLPEPQASPAPNSYQVVNYEGEPKHFMSGSVFVSGTTRWQPTGNTSYDGFDVPGPAHYRPLRADKQSFIYNASQRWI